MQATRAGEETKNATEKEQIELSCVAVMGENRGGEITKEQLEKELKKYDEKVKVEDKSGDILVTFPSGNEYTIGKDGTIEETPITMEEAKKKAKFDTKTKVKDILGNIVVVPEGFKIADDSASDVTGGIVIEDVENTETQGSQFVWIPVGEIKTASGPETITLSRYTFDSNGTETDKGTNNIYWGGYAYSEILEKNGTEEDGYNAVADKEVYEAFTNTLEKGSSRKSVQEVGGYYIGRYEARNGSEETARNNKENPLTQITENPNHNVYDHVTQNQASTLSKEMYQGKSFKSDLMNSYAWDTAIVFIQKFSGDEDYSYQRSLNTGGTPEAKGTKKLSEEKQDVRCNIWDMASNCFEWSTETCDSTRGPCTYRGDSHDWNDYYTSHRESTFAFLSAEGFSFRVLLIM